MKKIVDKIIVPITTVLILLVSVWVVTITMTGGKWYYRWQFNKNDTVEKLTWKTKDGEIISYDDEDLEVIMNQMVDYLMGKEEDMQVVIDGKNVFSNQAIYHMRDVKALFERWTIITIACIALLIACAIYIYKNFEDVKKNMFKKTMITYSVILAILMVVVVAMIVDFDWTFTQFHHILFPSPEKFKDAFFGYKSNYEELPYINNMLLVEILSIEVFSDAAFIIVGFILISLVAWSIFTYKYGRNEKNKKQVELVEEV